MKNWTLIIQFTGNSRLVMQYKYDTYGIYVIILNTYLLEKVC